VIFHSNAKATGAPSSATRQATSRILSRTSSGGVTINGFFSHYLENQLPFGGVNQSGMGSYHGVFGFKAFSHERAIYVQENRRRRPARIELESRAAISTTQGYIGMNINNRLSPIPVLLMILRRHTRRIALHLFLIKP
jgi:hypothetical protein